MGPSLNSEEAPMTTTSETQPSAQPSLGVVIPDLAGRSGLIGVEVDGQIVKVLRVDDGRVDLYPQTGQSMDAVLICRSEQDFWNVCTGRQDSIVASLRGRLAVRGRDLTLAMKVIRGLEASAHQRASEMGR
jgi:hypothetical protein